MSATMHTLCHPAPLLYTYMGSSSSLRALRGNSEERGQQNKLKSPLLQLVLGLQLALVSLFHSPFKFPLLSTATSASLVAWPNPSFWGVWASGNHIFLRLHYCTRLITVAVEHRSTRRHPTGSPELHTYFIPPCPHCVATALLSLADWDQLSLTRWWFLFLLPGLWTQGSIFR